MARVMMLIAPYLRSAREKVGEVLVHHEYDTLFLDLPRDTQDYIRAIAEGADHGEVIQGLEEAELIRRPEDTYKYKALEPVLKDLWRIRVENPTLEVFCYEEPTCSYTSLRSREIAGEIFAETGKAAIRGKVDVGRWRAMLKEELSLEIGAAREEASFIVEEAKEENACTASVGEDIVVHLEERGLKVRSMELGSYRAPLAVLRCKLRDELMGRGEVSDEEVRRLILAHVQFVRMVVTEEDFEKAYERWSKGWREPPTQLN
jgi:hypothetical protein